MTQRMIDRSCCFSFDDLFQAVHGRAMSPRERGELYGLPQHQRNRWVRQMVDQTRGSFACEDRQGSDGLTYTAFWQVDASI